MLSRPGKRRKMRRSGGKERHASSESLARHPLLRTHAQYNTFLRRREHCAHTTTNLFQWLKYSSPLRFAPRAKRKLEWSVKLTTSFEPLLR